MRCCNADAAAALAGWDTEYVRRSCKVLLPNSPTEVLGATLGGSAAATAAGQKVVAKVAELHTALAELDHPPTELVLTRRCADVAKLSYTLRCAGDRLDASLLEKCYTT